MMIGDIGPIELLSNPNRLRIGGDHNTWEIPSDLEGLLVLLAGGEYLIALFRMLLTEMLEKNKKEKEVS